MELHSTRREDFGRLRNAFTFFMCFKTKWGELSESTTISCSVEPLKETPQEAEWEELAQHSHLFPVTVE